MLFVGTESCSIGSFDRRRVDQKNRWQAKLSRLYEIYTWRHDALLKREKKLKCHLLLRLFITVEKQCLQNFSSASSFATSRCFFCAEVVTKAFEALCIKLPVNIRLRHSGDEDLLGNIIFCVLLPLSFRCDVVFHILVFLVAKVYVCLTPREGIKVQK